VSKHEIRDGEEIPERTIKYFREMLAELLKEKEPRDVRHFLARFIDEIRISETEAVIVGRWDKAGEPHRAGSAPIGLDWLPVTGEDTNPAEWTVRQPNVFTRHRVVCSVSGCTVSRYAKGYCNLHSACPLASI
jgi:hypothetical protein